MGWNDRLPEDPYWPAYYDAEAYEEWRKYLEACQQEELETPENTANLSSQNVEPWLLSAEPQPEPATRALIELQKKPAEVSIVERPGGCAAQQ